MMTLRVFTSHGLAADVEIELDAEESHYLGRVRRASVGQEVEVLDGRGGVHVGRVIAIDLRRAIVRLGAARVVPPSEPLELGLGYPEPSATLESMTHACEAGATVITLVRCQRSHGALPGAQRIDKVVRAALRQCGCPRPPQIRGPIDFEAWLAESPTGAFAWEEARGTATPIPTLDPSTRRVLVGPEGGLTQSEADRARAGGLVPIALGPWVQRTPTAVIAALTRLRFA